MTRSSLFKTPDGRFEVEDAVAIEGYLERYADVPLTFTVARGRFDEKGQPTGNEPTTHEISVSSQPRRTTGLLMKPGGIRAIQAGSPGEKAGLQVDDVLISVAGEPVEDLFALDRKLMGLVNQAIDLQVQRNGQPMDVQVTPQAPTALAPRVRHGGPLAIRTLGIAIPYTSTIAEIAQDAPTAAHNLQPGDTILKAEIVPAAGGDITAEDLAERYLNAV